VNSRPGDQVHTNHLALYRLPSEVIRRHEVHPHLHPHCQGWQKPIPRNRLHRRWRSLHPPRRSFHSHPAHQAQVCTEPSTSANTANTKTLQETRRPQLPLMEHGPAVDGNYNRPSGETWRGECLRPPPFSYPPKVPLSHCPAALVRSPVSQACIESRKEDIWESIINVTYVRIISFPVLALSAAYPCVSIVNGECTISFILVLRPSISIERGRDVSHTTP
jgi:hypothetical protein